MKKKKKNEWNERTLFLMCQKCQTDAMDIHMDIYWYVQLEQIGIFVIDS